MCKTSLKPPARGCFCRLPVITGQASPVITGQAWVRSDLSELPARLRAGCGSGGRVADPTVTAVRNVAGPPARLQAPRTQRRCCVSITCSETSAALPLRISSSITTHYSQHTAVPQDECCKALVDQRTYIQLLPRRTRAQLSASRRPDNQLAQTNAEGNTDTIDATNPAQLGASQPRSQRTPHQPIISATWHYLGECMHATDIMAACKGMQGMPSDSGRIRSVLHA